MRSLLLSILFSLFCAFSYGQDNIKFDSVIQADGKSLQQIIDASSTWVALNFKSANDVVQKKDKEAGLLIVKGNFQYTTENTLYSCYNGNINFTIIVTAREGRFKVELSDFEHNAVVNKSCSLGILTIAKERQSKGMGKNAKNEVWNDMKNESGELANNIFFSLKESVNQENNSSDDW